MLALNEVPSVVKTMVAELVEDIVRKEGSTKVTHARFIELMKGYAPEEVMERIERE